MAQFRPQNPLHPLHGRFRGQVHHLSRRGVHHLCRVQWGTGHRQKACRECKGKGFLTEKSKKAIDTGFAKKVTIEDTKRVVCPSCDGKKFTMKLCGSCRPIFMDESTPRGDGKVTLKHADRPGLGKVPCQECMFLTRLPGGQPLVSIESKERTSLIAHLNHHCDFSDPTISDLNYDITAFEKIPVIRKAGGREALNRAVVMAGYVPCSFCLGSGQLSAMELLKRTEAEEAVEREKLEAQAKADAQAKAKAKANAAAQLVEDRKLFQELIQKSSRGDVDAATLLANDYRTGRFEEVSKVKSAIYDERVVSLHKEAA